MRRIVIILIAISTLSALLSVNAIAADPEIRIKPIDPRFTSYIQELYTGNITHISDDGNGLGMMPRPFNLSHLKGKNITAAALYPSLYDLRALGKVTSVKNQNPAGTCWAFATYGSLESNQTFQGQVWDFSENNLKNLAGFDLDPNNGGGTDVMSTAYLGRWAGPVNESADPYNPYTTYSPPGLPIMKHVQDVYWIPGRSGPLSNNDLKWAITNMGGVYSGFLYSGGYYNYSSHSYYYNGPYGGNHAITLVGWDDSYSRYNFSITPPGDGAFICKNSWGTGWGDNGYFYISYYDTTIAFENAAFTAEPLTDYAGSYQYDTLGLCYWIGYADVSDTAWFANVFTATTGDTLSAVSFYAASNSSTYDIYVYIDPVSGPINPGGYAYHATGTLAMPGYHTVNVNPSVQLTSGHRFSVVVRQTTPGFTYPIPAEGPLEGYSSNATSGPEQGYISAGGTVWSDLYYEITDASVCLKAFTTASPSPNASVVSNTITSSMQPGQSYSVTVTMNNTGNVAWTEADLFRLGGVGDSTGDAAKFGSYRIQLPPGVTVNPGSSYAFAFTMTAPSTPGVYTPQYRMVWDGHQWFGQTLTKQITVGTPAPNASVISNTIPASMSPGQSYSINITMNNTGNIAWTVIDLFRLGGVGDSTGDAAKFGPIRSPIPTGVTVSPGSQYTWTFTMTAPSTSGVYTPQYRMVWDGHQWFGQTLTKQITVGTPSPNASVVSNTITSSMQPGQSYSVTVTMNNTGNVAWTEADLFRLGGVGDSTGDAAKFGSYRIQLPPGVTVNPGSSYAFAFTMTAPSTPGVYTPQYRMVWDGHQWFGQTLTKQITVGTPAPNATFTAWNVPATMTAGNTYMVNMTVNNTGNVAWTEADLFRLGGVDDSEGDAWKFGVIRELLPPGVTVAPGTSYMWTFAMTAPPTPGMYNPSFRMVWDGHQWFGQTLTRPVTVT